MPFTKNFLQYDTSHGNVKHFYGFTFALGGIVSVKGADFDAWTSYLATAPGCKTALTASTTGTA
jgi:hypothetical protein